MLLSLILMAMILYLSFTKKFDNLGFSFASLSREPNKKSPFNLFNGKFFAIITAGIMSTVKGKVGGIVGSTWKGINTLREYKIPANPQSAGQVLQRNRFATIQSFASQLLSTIITTYWNPFAIKMSGYNYFIQQNIAALAPTTYYLTTSNVMSKGSLEPVKTVAGTLSGGVVTITWDKQIIGNGSLTDNILLVVVNKETFATYVEDGTDTRDDETGNVTVTGETDATKLICFVSCYKGTGSSFVVSNSESAQVTT